MVNILAIETSCDETSVAIVNNNREILFHEIWSQVNSHVLHGGVVPEIAARDHLAKLPELIDNALSTISISNIDAFAATGGPGLIGALITGLMMAKSMAYVSKKPFIAVNHLVGHALTARLTHNVPYPYLLLLISGGHCQIVVVKNYNNYHILGQTIDDSVGEAFDKVARMLGLNYPGGPIIEQYAILGEENSIKFPLSLCNQDNCDFSFSGLKTAVRREIELTKNMDDKRKYDICASFQDTVAQILCNKLAKAISEISDLAITNLVAAGGVAANQYIRNKLKNIAAKNNMNLVVPEMKLCTDNAAMIAWAAHEMFANNNLSNLSCEPKPSWRLDSW